LSPGEVPASAGYTPPVSRLAAVIAGSHRVLSCAATPPLRGGRLSVSTRNPVIRTDRAHADRLRARRLPTRLADATGLPLPGITRSRTGHRRRLRHLHAPRGVSAGRQPLWP